jgi:hypothetical protein
MFDPSGGAVLKRFSVFDQWWDINRERIYNTFEVTFDRVKPIMPYRELPLTGGVTIVYPSDMKAAVAKGLAIRLELMAVLDTLTATDREHSYFVLIDGSGAIDYNGIERVLEKLIHDPAHPEIVLGRRPKESKNWFMGHPERKVIELFEKFLIEEQFRKIVDEEFDGELPDAQAGCWGLRLDTLRKLSLTEGGYELEFDVITSALQLLEHGLLGKKKVTFTSDLSQGQRIGGGGAGGDSGKFTLNRATTIDKFPFFLHKLGYDKSTLLKLLERFERMLSATLPQEYVTAVREWIYTN